MKPFGPLFVIAVAAAAGCSLVTSTDGLSDGPASPPGMDASITDAAATDAGDGGSTGDASACPCPKGTTETNGVCVLVMGQTAGYTCTEPIEASLCARTYEARLCAADPTFAYDTGCGGTPSQSIFFSLAALPPQQDGGPSKWIASSSGTEVIARTNAACTLASAPCGVGPGPGGSLAGAGATVTWGKRVIAGCSNMRVDLRAAVGN